VRTSDTLAKLAEALAQAQGKMRPAPLNAINPHFKSRYADLSSVREAVIPALTEHGLSVVQVPSLDEAGNFVLITRLLHASGEWLQSSYPLPMDPAKPQALGSALTYARRYSLSAITGIAADEDDDAAGAEKQAKSKPTKPRNAPHIVLKLGNVSPSFESRAAAAEALMAAITDADSIDILTRLDHDNREFVDKLPEPHQKTFRKAIGDKAQELIRTVMTTDDDDLPFDDTDEAVTDLEGRDQ
jgi:ERF superfamily